MEIFFDLDGTLTDSGVGITRCLQYALVNLGKPVPTADALRRFVGPPLRTTLVEILSTQDEVTLGEGIRLYRERFTAVGMFENDLYADVPLGLETLRHDGHRLWVVTSKPYVYACQIIQHFELAQWFERVYGSELSGVNTDKGDLIREVLSREHISPQQAWMVGDRIHDIQGARKNSVGAIAVTWGYGTEQELQEARPDHLVASMAELCEYLHGHPRRRS